jgi:hypothetical protein
MDMAASVSPKLGPLSFRNQAASGERVTWLSYSHSKAEKRL